MSFLEADDVDLTSQTRPPLNIETVRPKASSERKHRATMSNRSSFSIRSGPSATSSAVVSPSVTSEMGDVTSVGETRRKSTKASQPLPQYYRGNHGEVSPIRVRPVFMTRYTFRDHLSAASGLAADGLAAKDAEDVDDFLEDTIDVGKDDKENVNRRASTANKSLYSHVLHRVKTFGGEDRRRSSIPSENLSQPQNRPQQHQQHHTDEDQLSMWLEKIRRRKAYRSPFSALVPGCGDSHSSSSTTVGIEEEEEGEAEDRSPPFATPSYYVDASASTPSRILNYILPGEGPSTSPGVGDPFQSPESVVRGRRGGCTQSERRKLREGWMREDDD